MYCNNCGKENKDGVKFCEGCGKELTKNSEGLGTASLVIGIISLVLTFILTVLTLPLSITGLILGIVNKAKKGKKVAGIVLNIISIVLSFLLVFVYLFIGIGIISAIFSTEEGKEVLNQVYNEMERIESDNYVSGKYNCKSFDGSGASGDYIVRFELNKDMTFMWGKYNDTYRNYVKGDYTYEDLDKKDASGKYTYYKISLDGDEFYQDGVKQSDPYVSKYEIGITKESGKKQGILMNEKTYNMYYCFEE